MIILFDQFLVDTKPRALFFLDVLDLFFAILVIAIVSEWPFPWWRLLLLFSSIIILGLIIISLLVQGKRGGLLLLLLCGLGVELGEEVWWKVFPSVYKHWELFEIWLRKSRRILSGRILLVVEDVLVERIWVVGWIPVCIPPETKYATLNNSAYHLEGFEMTTVCHRFLLLFSDVAASLGTSLISLFK